MKQVHWKEKLQHLFEKLFFNTIAYLDEQGRVITYRLEGGELIEQVGIQPKLGGCLVLSASYYYERTEEYPLERRKELNQVLKHEACQYPDCDKLIYRASKATNGSTKVFFWEIDTNQLPNEANQFQLIAPESLLLSLKAELSGRTIISALSPQLEISIKDQLIQTQFTHSSASLKLSKSEYWRALFGGLVRSMPLFTQLRTETKPFNWKQYRPFLVSLGLSIFLLQGFEAAMLVYKTQKMESQLEEYAPQLDQAFATQKQYRNAVKNYTQLAQTLPKESSLHPQFWQTMLPLFNEKEKTQLQFFFIRFNGESYQFSGSAENASDILRAIKASPSVADAKFLSDVQRTKRGERFIVDLRLARAEGDK